MKHERVTNRALALFNEREEPWQCTFFFPPSWSNSLPIEGVESLGEGDSSSSLPPIEANCYAEDNLALLARLGLYESPEEEERRRKAEKRREERMRAKEERSVASERRHSARLDGSAPEYAPLEDEDELMMIEDEELRRERREKRRMARETGGGGVNGWYKTLYVPTGREVYTVEQLNVSVVFVPLVLVH